MASHLNLRPNAQREGGPTFLPNFLFPAHDFCFLNHDVLVEMLRSGEESGAFKFTVHLRNGETRPDASDPTEPIEWLKGRRGPSELARCLRQLVFPAVLSDFLHFIYEALETSRKAKLNVSFALLRKPLQESLFLLETIALDVDEFARRLEAEPTSLHGPGAGGAAAHEQRVRRVLTNIGEQDRFDASYVAQLRYDKQSDDGFAGSCDKATHLFTTNPAIRTEALNINWVFSGWEEKLSQWYFIYSRLPYLLFYARLLVEHVCATFRRTDPVYLGEIERRLMAKTALWWPAVDPGYKHPAIATFVARTGEKLRGDCAANGFRAPSRNDLVRMAESGAWPGESALRVAARHARFRLLNLPSAVGEAARHILLKEQTSSKQS